MPNENALISDFEARGFAFVPDVVPPETVGAIGERFAALFNGDFETGVHPDEVNWQTATGDPTLTRQICNGWRADTTIARTVMDIGIAQSLAKLMGWDGVRLMQDNLLWKPPGTRSLGFHRDSSYAGWYTPSEMVTCWIALDDTSSDGGTLEFAVGSHLWVRDDDHEITFHAPKDYRQPVRLAAEQSEADLSIEFVELSAGSVSFHHGWTWHGSGPNTSTTDRKALAIHCAPAQARFDRANLDQGNGPLYGHYCSDATDEFPEEHFPITWHESGYRSPRVEELTNDG